MWILYEVDLWHLHTQAHIEIDTTHTQAHTQTHKEKLHTNKCKQHEQREQIPHITWCVECVTRSVENLVVGTTQGQSTA